ncbi:hypothetical protein [Aurantibacter sp.]|uniref:hypothetical protein n=1 Tax=Aurantibacter sp. TaxID=2807103 RepID=UPI0035C7C2A7
MKNLSKLLLLAILPLLSVSCIVDDEAETGFEASAYIVGFEKSSTLESYFSDIGAVNVDVAVNLLGGNSGIELPSDVTVSYTVDPASTAIEGNEFSLLGSSFTMQEGYRYGILPLQINTGGLDPDTPTELILRLTTTDSNNTVVSSANNTFSITFVGCQSDHAGSYTSPAVTSSTAPNTVITELAPNTYRIESMPYLAFGGGGGAPAYMDFTNVCGEVKATGWVAATLIDAPAVVDEVTGAITFEYLKIYNGDDVASGIWFELPAATYTPN